MITKELLWRIRNELPMKLTIQRLGNFGPIAKCFARFEVAYKNVC